MRKQKCRRIKCRTPHQLLYNQGLLLINVCQLPHVYMKKHSQDKTILKTILLTVLMAKNIVQLMQLQIQAFLDSAIMHQHQSMLLSAMQNGYLFFLKTICIGTCDNPKFLCKTLVI